METLGEVIHKVKERCGTAPEEFGFDFDNKADTVYKLIMPKVDDIRSDELMQTCKSIGFELFRLLNPKLDPPGTNWPSTCAPRSKVLASTRAGTLAGRCGLSPCSTAGSMCTRSRRARSSLQERRRRGQEAGRQAL